MNFKTRYLNVGEDEQCVLKFCNECDKLKYVNNSSLNAMKWEWDQVKWVGTFLNDKIISLSGIHPFPEINKNSFRIMFRGASLPGYSNKMLNFCQVPLKIEYAYLLTSNPEFYVTFNTSDKIGVKSKRMSKAISRRNDFKYIKTMNYFNVEQEVWKFFHENC